MKLPVDSYSKMGYEMARWDMTSDGTHGCEIATCDITSDRTDISVTPRCKMRYQRDTKTRYQIWHLMVMCRVSYMMVMCRVSHVMVMCRVSYMTHDHHVPTF